MRKYRTKFEKKKKKVNSFSCLIANEKNQNGFTLYAKAKGHNCGQNNFKSVGASEVGKGA